MSDMKNAAKWCKDDEQTRAGIRENDTDICDGNEKEGSKDEKIKADK